tara:strand:+ start:120 stop:701 length:582 start_codon:yes stop_codon:yes gene_type:complete
MDRNVRKVSNSLETEKRRITAVENTANQNAINHTALSSSHVTLNNNYTTGSTERSGSLSSTDYYRGNVLIAGTGSHAQVSGSHLVYLDSTKQWRRATGGLTNSGSGELIGIALSKNPHSNGVLVRGAYLLSSSFASGSAGKFSIGKQVYMHPTTSGSFTTLQPSTSGQVVRVVGHAIDAHTIYFNASPDYIEV